MGQPVFPLIGIGENGYLELECDFSCVSAYAFLTQAVERDYIYYSAGGNGWTCALAALSFKNTMLNRLLTHTFYSPTIAVRAHWKWLRTYELDELKKRIAWCVDKDDDVLTQFEEGDWIKQEVNKAASFDELVGVLRKYIFDVDETALWEEQEAREQ